MTIAKTIHKRDPLSFVSGTYQKFNLILQTKRTENKSFQSFESKFKAAVCSFNSAVANEPLPQSLVAFILIGNANSNDGQRVSILSAPAPKSEDCSDEESGQDEDNTSLFSKIKYESIAAIITQFDKFPHYKPDGVLQANSGFTKGQKPFQENNYGKYKKRLSLNSSQS